LKANRRPSKSGFRKNINNGHISLNSTTTRSGKAIGTREGDYLDAVLDGDARGHPRPSSRRTTSVAADNGVIGSEPGRYTRTTCAASKQWATSFPN
jgi:hypothetical protein